MVYQRINSAAKVKVHEFPFKHQSKLRRKWETMHKRQIETFLDLCGNRTHDLRIKPNVALSTQLRGQTGASPLSDKERMTVHGKENVKDKMNVVPHNTSDSHGE